MANFVKYFLKQKFELQNPIFCFDLCVRMVCGVTAVILITSSQFQPETRCRPTIPCRCPSSKCLSISGMLFSIFLFCLKLLISFLSDSNSTISIFEFLQLFCFPQTYHQPPHHLHVKLQVYNFWREIISFLSYYLSLFLLMAASFSSS